MERMKNQPRRPRRNRGQKNAPQNAGNMYDQHPRRVKQAVNEYLGKYGVNPDYWNTSLVPFQRLAQTAVTEDGMKYMINVMDPAASTGAAEGRVALGASNPGVPDYKTGNILMQPTPLSETFGPPNGINTDETWDMCVIVTPIPECPFIVFKRISAQGTDWNDLIAGTWALNDNGVNASWWYLPQNLPDGAYPSTNYSHLRLVSRSVTSETVGALLYKGGTVTSGQVPANFMFTPYNPSDQLSSSPKVGTVCWKMPQLGSDVLFQFDRLAKQRDATLGDYNVLRISEPSGCPVDEPTIKSGQLGVCDYTQTQVNNINWMVSSHHVTYGASFNVGLIYFEAIAPENNIRLKLHGFLEGTPNMGGPLASLSKVAPASDPAAIQLVNDITNELPHSYPASYNDLGGLLGVIGHVIHGVSGVVQHLGIPVASGVAGVIHGISGALLN
jgi:hypothetical protein